ncbi:MAG TPA: hypothetical protein PK250_07540 [Syntrophobacter fumaroxidans]|nr:hypothetical protein [Syntrophobacter fumaroxidans]
MFANMIDLYDNCLYYKLPPNDFLREFGNSFLPRNWNLCTQKRQYITKRGILNVHLDAKKWRIKEEPDLQGRFYGISAWPYYLTIAKIGMYQPKYWIDVLIHELAHVAERRWIMAGCGYQRRIDPFDDAGQNYGNQNIIRDKLRFKNKIISLTRRGIYNVLRDPHGHIFMHFYELLSDRVCKRFCYKPYIKRYGYCPLKLECEYHIMNFYVGSTWEHLEEPERQKYYPHVFTDDFDNSE